jgi:phage repressor protein C with HTH and peptisase S24 domain
MPTLGNRIKHIRGEILKVNQSSFAEELGFSRVATISDYEKDKRSPNIATLRKIASLGTVSLDWLLTGKKSGIYLYHPNSSDGAVRAGDAFAIQDYVTVEVYSISCPDEQSDDTWKLPLNKPIDFINISRSDYCEALVAIKTEGDCMAPNLLDGSIVGIDQKDTKIISGKLYAVWLKYEGISIKRVFVHTDRIVLKPDNPTFTETVIPDTSITKNLILGRIKWSYQHY